jgi:thiol-disulfide isomerase/thioredoxin
LRKQPAQIVSALTVLSLFAIFASGCGRSSSGISGQLPKLNFKTYQGESFTLDGQGKEATLLVFWATWCGPCMMEIPSLVELHEKYKNRNFRIVSINLDDPEGQKVKGIVADYHIKYTMLLGSDETARQFGGVNALPTSFLVGRDGKIKEKVQGLLPEEELERKIQALLADAS